MPCVQEKREEYQRTQREKEDREVEEKKRAAREQVQYIRTPNAVLCVYVQVHNFILHNYVCNVRKPC